MNFWMSRLAQNEELRSREEFFKFGMRNFQYRQVWNFYILAITEKSLYFYAYKRKQFGR